MTRDERWRRIEALARKAFERDAGERDAFLDAACDVTLRRDVEQLVATYERARNGVTVLARPSFRPPPAVELEPGRELGPYRIVDQIGGGSMATVYLATPADGPGPAVAIKVARRDVDADHLDRIFRAERAALQRLDHPNIARLHGAGTLDDGRPYVVVEHVDGLPIDEHCERRGLPIRDRLELVVQVCGAVHYAHRHGVVHRDVKPINILVTREGTPKLLDFGISLHDGDRGRADERLMTPQYASPEQIRGGEITPSSDVYSLGVLLFQLLTATLPYGDEPCGPREMERRLAEGPPPPPSSVATLSNDRRGKLHGELDAIVIRALAHRPERRHASAEQLSEALSRWLATAA